jgi:hypothetical protein
MKKLDFDEALKKIEKINEIVSKLDPLIKESAFEFLLKIGFSDVPKKEFKEEREEVDQSDSGGDDFLTKYSHDQPSDNVLLIAASLYSKHGVFPITRADIKSTADDSGLTIPGRPDMTMKAAQSDGKKLFSKSGDGYKLTVNGEAYLKKTYKVKKGNKPLSEEAK